MADYRALYEAQMKLLAERRARIIKLELALISARDFIGMGYPAAAKEAIDEGLKQSPGEIHGD